MKTQLSQLFSLVCSITLASVAISAALPIQNAQAWGRFDGGHHPTYGGGWARPNPVVVHNTYVRGGGGGCIGCGIGAAAVAGLVGGVIIGSALASPPPPQTVIVNQAPQAIVVQGPPIGAQVPVLPPGCANMNVNGATLYQCGGIWYQPFFGGNGVYYSVVQAP
jgi:hypothetical protein